MEAKVSITTYSNLHLLGPETSVTSRAISCCADFNWRPNGISPSKIFKYVIEIQFKLGAKNGFLAYIIFDFSRSRLRNICANRSEKMYLISFQIPTARLHSNFHTSPSHLAFVTFVTSITLLSSLSSHQAPCFRHFRHIKHLAVVS